MSANYWNSTQRNHWQFTREKLNQKRNELVHLENKVFVGDNSSILQNGVKYDCNLRIYIHHLILRLGRKLCLRQVILLTLEIFVTRFLTQVSVKEVNIYVLVTTLIYIACKIEEYPQHIRSLLNESRNIWPEYIPNDLTRIAEFEFYLIEELDSFLIVHHPYQLLLQLISIFNSTNGNNMLNGMNSAVTSNSNLVTGNASAEDTTGEFKINLTTEEIQMCWSIINDSYITDIPLLYPPHIALVMAVYLTIGIKSGHAHSSHNLGTVAGNSESQQNSQQKKVEVFTRFLAVSNIDLNELIELTQDMLTLYEQWENYEEHGVKKNVHQLLMALSRSGL